MWTQNSINYLHRMDGERTPKQILQCILNQMQAENEEDLGNA
jgi:hypothetical protein